jgi:hypothetical protein
MSRSDGYLFWQCPECGWDTVLRNGKDGVGSCPLCMSDKGRYVRLRSRPAMDTDQPEGPDERTPLRPRK